jgi:hypothetical protein
MYHGDSGPQDQAADAAMAALYWQLDYLDLPGEVPFDTAAGLRDLIGRIQAEPAREPRSAPDAREPERLASAAHMISHPRDAAAGKRRHWHASSSDGPPTVRGTALAVIDTGGAEPNPQGKPSSESEPVRLAAGTHWEPALTSREAAKLGIPKNEYKAAFLYARTAAEEHQARGTRRDLWEPTANLNDMLAAPYIAKGEQEMAGRLKSEADPALGRAQGLLENVRETLDKATEYSLPISAPESGANFSVAEAVRCAERHAATIEWDEAAGLHHHRRASPWLRRLAALAPWVEAVGFLTFMAYYLNVPVFQPWLDWLGWSFGATAVTVITVGQAWLVRHAAVEHNYAREARANGHRHQAENGLARRNRFAALTAATAAAITSGMIWRGLAALGTASPGTDAVVVFTAAVTGLLLPVIAYLGVALDGSRVSRERDSLAADLDNDLEAYLKAVSDSRRDLARVAEIGGTLKDKTFPDICATTQEAVDEVYHFYGTVRMFIGALSADPPDKTPLTVHRDIDGNITGGHIGTRIPGTRTVDLSPLLNRVSRLAEIERQAGDLLSRVEALPAHPWGRPRTN